MDRPSKRKRPDIEETTKEPRSLSVPISPPRKHRRPPTEAINSPWQLTWIRDLPEELNHGAITLRDILGDPLIRECWEFNYLHDINFLMNAFDPDTRSLVQVHVVHGFWKREDPNRLALSDEASRYKNVTLHTAPMPEMFGTHHSKMMILFRHDDTAQVVIHTANMIHKDWTNMTNAVWRSPALPKLATSDLDAQDYSELAVGSGLRFKVDLLAYLRAYDRLRPICKAAYDQLGAYDFAGIRGALVASVPGRHDAKDRSRTAWGWAGAKQSLRSIPCKEGDAEIVAQISSIATLGAKNTWLQETLFDSLAVTKTTAKLQKRAKFKVMFPTADEIRNSLDGYASGGSIHTKIQSPQQAQQLAYMRPIFHHWANDSRNGVDLPTEVHRQDAGRDRAAPHIKTYIRYNSENTIDWAMLTSANISKQAWGEAAKSSSEMRLASWEIGVLIWPELYGTDFSMVGTFKSDAPDTKDVSREGSKAVGLRIPYSLPLQRYGDSEVPWVATLNHSQPDCLGRRWMD